MVFFLANYWKIYFYWKKRWAFELGVPGDNHILYIFSREFSLISLVSLFYLLFDLWCTCFITKTEVLFFLSLCSRSWFLGENSLSQLSRFTFLLAKLYHEPTTYFSNPLKPSPRIQKKYKKTPLRARDISSVYFQLHAITSLQYREWVATRGPLAC